MATPTLEELGSAYTVHEAAGELGIYYTTIRRYIRDGLLPAYKLGGRVRILRRDLEALARPVGGAK